MYITHVSPPKEGESFLIPLSFLCTEHPDSILFQVEFQPDVILTIDDVQEQVETGSFIVLPNPVQIDSKARIPWLDPSGHIWLLDKDDPYGDSRPEKIGFLH